MFKLIDIIKGGGSNPKLNKFLNRYVISKKEKTNLIKLIKNSKGGSSDSLYFIANIQDVSGNYAPIVDYIGVLASTVSFANSGTGGYIYTINTPITYIFSGLAEAPNTFICYKIILGHIEYYKSNDSLPGIAIDVDINNKEDLFSVLSSLTNIDINLVKEKIIEIAEEQFFDKEWLLEQASK